MSSEKVVKTIKNNTVPVGVHIFPHIDIQEAVIVDRQQPGDYYLLMRTWVPVIRESVYLVPLIQRSMVRNNKADVLDLKKEAKAQFMAQVASIQTNYIIDDESIFKIGSYFMYPENMYYKMDYGI